MPPSCKEITKSRQLSALTLLFYRRVFEGFFQKRDNEFPPLDMILVIEQRGVFPPQKTGETVCRVNLILTS
jgi:hypothetical protein